MNAATRKKRFQVHLSTAVLLMIAAGGIVSANAMPQIRSDYRLHPACRGEGWLITSTEYGWPVEHSRAAVVRPANFSPAIRHPTSTDWRGLAINTNFMLAMLGALWFLSEWLIRRRATRKAQA